MGYTIGEVAKMLNIAPSTLRYYDKEGLLPFVERSDGGIRIFREKDFGWLRIVECLKKSGLSIKDIKRYMDMAQKGDESIEERLELFCRQREKVREQIVELQNTLEVLDYKCWYYETAKTAGTVDVPQNMPAEKIPPEIRTVKEKLNSIQKNTTAYSAE